jgi:type IV pilus assembly protein PilX
MRSQRGAVLIVALVLLLVLTILGTAGIQDTTMEERMAGNFRDHSAAMQAAETALRTGEMELGSSVFGGLTFGSSAGTYDIAPTSQSVDPATASYDRLVPDTVLKKGGDSSGELLVNEVPAFYLEQLPEIELPASDLTVGFQDQAPRVRYYRVTARGSGISPNAEVILQSTYFR